MDRRKFIKAQLVSGSTALLASAGACAKHVTLTGPTPPEIEGPFYPVVGQKDKDFDLTVIDGHKQAALGQVINIHGQILDIRGIPIEDATIDIWQANAAGKYRHPHDSNPAPLDPNFQGWGILQSGKQGRYTIKTILPGIYPVSNEWQRPPHIHFKVSKLGFASLTTQMYFPGHPLNKADRLLNRKGKKQQNLMIAKLESKETNTYRYDIYLDSV